jgi:hypothetical protein
MGHRFRLTSKVHASDTRFIRHWLMCLFLLLPLAARAAGPGSLISPGACVGKICLNSSRNTVQQILGKPAFAKENPGKYSADVWKSRQGQLLIVVYVMNKVTDIHLTSASFSTSGGVSASSSFDDVKHEFPIGREDEYAVFENGHNRMDWIVPSQGITFTFSGDSTGPLVRIAVHKRNAAKTVGYSRGELWYWTGLPD